MLDPTGPAGSCYIRETVEAVQRGEACHPLPSLMAEEDFAPARLARFAAEAGVPSAGLVLAFAGGVLAHKVSYALGAGNERLRIVAWLAALGERAKQAGSPNRAAVFGNLAAELLLSIQAEKGTPE